jgi:glyoxylase-like metal-dependent hydrolase (beta-lactamase superfamily II)
MRYIPILCLAVLAVSPLHAHSGAAAPAAAPEPQLKLEQLSAHAWVLYGTGGNVGFLATEAGVLVVDDQYENVAQGIVDKIRSVTDAPIRYLVNTHYHSDHTGGNPVFARLAEIVAHHSVRARLLEFPLEQKRDLPAEIVRLQEEIARLEDEDDPYRKALEKELALAGFMNESAQGFDRAAAAPPALTFEDGVRVYLADQEVEIFHVGPGHTDGDVVVYFVDEKVLHMGDVFWNGMYPFIDRRGGGSLSGMIKTIEKALDRVAPETRVIPGHGPVTDVAGLRRFGRFLSDLRTAIRRAADAGLSVAEAIRTIEMKEYPEIAPRFMTLGNDILAGWDDETRPPR